MSAPTRNKKKKKKKRKDPPKIMVSMLFLYSMLFNWLSFKENHHLPIRKLSRLCYTKLIHRMKKVTRVFKPFLYLIAGLHILEMWINRKLCYSLKATNNKF